MNKLLWPIAAGMSGLAYSLWEATAFTVRHVSVPILPSGSGPLKILHLSDTHLTPAQHKKQRWIKSLAALRPDLVISTGDNLAHREAVPPLLRAYDDLLDLPGVFVFGSNDYVSPRPKNPALYLRKGRGLSTARRFDLPWRDLQGSFTRRGWKDLTNQHAELTINGLRLAFVGVDDPHLERDRLDDIQADPTADLAIGVTHAPYLRVLDRWNALGYPLILAGHTHGGQLCVPGHGALVTNCDLNPARAKGLSAHRIAGHKPSWLHVSAGIGTSPYTPVRFACRPEATMLTLTGIDSPSPRN